MTPRTRSSRSFLPAAVVLGGCLVVSGASGAVAARMITGADIKNGTVTTADVARYTLEPADTSAKLDRYMRRVGGYASVHTSVPVEPGQTGTASVACPAGTSVLGTTGWWDSSAAGVQVVARDDFEHELTAYGTNALSIPDTLHVVAWCGATT